MLTYPKIDPVLFSVGPLSIHWYGIMYLLAFGSAWFLARRRASRPGSTWTLPDIDNLIFAGVLGVIVGGRIGYVLFYGWELWREDWLYPVKMWEGGMSFHGGLLGVLVAYGIFAARYHRNVGDVLDFIAPLGGPGLFFVRVGNFINGELWGKPTDVPWAFVYEGVPRHASQLYEAVLEGIVLGTVVWVFSAKPRPRWATGGLFLLGYGLIRFALEFVRVPDANRGYLLWGWVTEGQILSVPMVIGGIILLAVAYRNRTPSGNLKVSPAAPPRS